MACRDLQPRARDLLAPRRRGRELDCKRRRNSCQAACCNRGRLDEMHARRCKLCPPAAREMNEIDAKVSPAVAQQTPSRAIGHAAMDDRMRKRTRPGDRFQQRQEPFGERRRRDRHDGPRQSRLELHM